MLTCPSPRKLFIALILFLASLFLPTNTFAQTTGATLSLSPSSATYNRGCNFNVDINLNTGGVNTDGTDVILRFDRTRLTAVSVTPGDVYSDYPSSAPDNANGVVSISGLASIDEPFNGSGKFATVTFTANPSAATGLTQVTFDFDPNDKQKTTDSNVVETATVQDVLNSVQNGVYTISTGACSTPSSPAPSATTRPPVVTGGPGTFGGGTTSSSSGITTLPEGGITDPTVLIALAGGFLTLIGVIGLSIL